MLINEVVDMAKKNKYFDREKKYKKHYFRKKISIPIYTGSLVLLFTNQSSKLPLDLQDANEDLFAISFIGDKQFVPVGKKKFSMCFNFWYYSPITHGDIAHEVSHIVDEFAKYHGIKRAKVNEPVAYLAGWFTNEVYKFVKECKLKVCYA